MLKKLIILLLLSASFSVFSDESLILSVDELCFEPSKRNNEMYSGKSICKHSNGLISSEGKFKNGKKEDKWTYWNKNGQKSYEMHYKDGGKLVNKTKYTYYGNGQLKGVKNYNKDGKYDGKVIKWKKNGQKLNEKKYHDGGKLVSNTKYTYYDNGQLKGVKNYNKDGKYDGKWIEFYENGKKSSEGSFINGKENGKWIYWHENGKKSSEGSFINGKEDGNWTSWEINGTSAVMAVFKMGIKDAVEIEYGSNGLISSETELINNVKTVFEYFPNGQLKSQKIYKDSLKIGSHVRWHQNGTKAHEANYKDDHLDGKMLQWNENGKKLFEKNYYDSSLLTGTTYLYNENGQLIEEKQVKNDLFDENGQLIVENQFKNDGLVTSKIQYEYYANGQMKSEIGYNDVLGSGYVNNWDETGKILVQMKYNQDFVNGKIFKCKWDKTSQKRFESEWEMGICVSGEW